MTNPWLEVSLDEYEAHMSLPHVAQAQMLARLFGEALSEHRPASVALLGCAGGNGLEHVAADRVDRVVGVDLNPAFIDAARRRFEGRLPQLEFHVGDVQSEALSFAPVQLVFAGLLFEYVDVETALRRVREMLLPGGVLITVLQQPSEAQAAVSTSPYAERLSILSPLLRLVDPAAFAEAARAAGLAEEARQVEEPAPGKRFLVQTWREATPEGRHQAE